MGEKGNIVETGAASIADRARDVAVDVASTTAETAKGIAVGMATARVQERFVDDGEETSDPTLEDGGDAADEPDGER